MEPHTNQIPARHFWTATLRDGTVVLAKLYHGNPTPMTYANRTQAERMAASLGPSWEVIHRGRPWYVRKVSDA